MTTRKIHYLPSHVDELVPGYVYEFAFKATVRDLERWANVDTVQFLVRSGNQAWAVGRTAAYLVSEDYGFALTRDK